MAVCEMEVNEIAQELIRKIFVDLSEEITLLAALLDSDIDETIFENIQELVGRTRLHSSSGDAVTCSGRPSFDIPAESIEHFLLCGLKVRQISYIVVCVARQITSHLFLFLSVSDLYSQISDDALDAIISNIQRHHPNMGYKMIHGLLKSQGVQVPGMVQKSVHRVDPEGVVMRSLRLHTLIQRQYSVPGPNCLWHIDGNHKLIRFVVHGGIDGFSRLLVYLTLSANNRADTVLNSFLSADGENVRVAELMVQRRGVNRNSHITGRSVHNQRIERMWRDVYEHVLDLFYSIFFTLERQQLLEPDNELHLFSLHWNFLPLIQSNLKSFQNAWNHHGLRSEGNQTPLQLWMGHTAQDLDDSVSVPEIQLPHDLTDAESASLPAPADSCDDAVANYVETVQLIRSIFN
uniref:Integrase core domain-containing protein n=1 Tax=Erpetoichthys calabaricus TaxID=27687 RepID=A0A8C4XD48_ERPCA